MQDQAGGYIYYVKFKFPKQPVLYKIGYTANNSVTRRFSYAGFGDEKYIDKVIACTYLPNALAAEQELHRHFRRWNAFGVGQSTAWPLYQRGQSELYKFDVLELDDPEIITLPEFPDLPMEIRSTYQEGKKEPVDTGMEILVVVLVALSLVFWPLWILTIALGWPMLTGGKVIPAPGTPPEPIKRIIAAIKKGA